MIKVYDQSWHILVRKKYSDLHSQKQWNGLSIVHEFKNFMDAIPDDSNVWDIGCGFNIIKEYYPWLNITGVDKTWEADIEEHLEQSKMHDYDVDNAFAINSIHFGDIETISDRISYVMDCLPKGGQFFATLNRFGSEEEFDEFGNPEFWMQFGQVQDLTFKSKKWNDEEYHIMGEFVRQFLGNARLDGEYDIDKEVESIWESAIASDSLWGRCRITLRK